MDKFNKKEYDKQYNKDNYTSCNVRLRKKEADILAEFAHNMGVSNPVLLQKCMIYCWENMIDVSDVKLSKPEK